MFRSCLAAAFSLASLPAFADCGGPAFMDRLTDTERTQIETTVAATPFPSGLLWQASREKMQVTIIGTMHIYDPRLAPLVAELTPLVQGADILLVEATAKEEAEMQSAIANNPEMVFITDGPTLPEQLDEDTWQALSEASSARQIPPFMAAKMQPWYLSLALAIPPCAMPDIVAGRRGLDHMLMEAAAAADVPMQAVEPWTTLLDVMQAGSAAEQLEMLQLGLMAPDLQSEMFVSMLDAYFSENVAEIWEASRIAVNYVPGLDPERGRELFAETEDLILTQRNLAWIPEITTAALAHSDVVLAVGAAHLPGEQGLLNLLAQDGWTVTPLR
ncbi:hypothetical protein SAMN04488515_0325 [Cognatiyoonia koreensis]|uniref:TraB family protein n=1 Tax=Cognatiyoonia koreensis TaxID=364200 RepID=A0A1I0MZI3_9RHOB|nr:TraB/GumN family protein [Cognatiyoonia koreensis]SEV94054.1 hypothetical protein SAMN04488515_0325 [Cognatiyoonia koreensis]